MPLFPPFTRDRQSTWPWTTWGLPATSRVTFPPIRKHSLDPVQQITNDALEGITNDAGEPVFTDDSSVTVAVTELPPTGGDRQIVTWRWSVDRDDNVSLRLITAAVEE